MAEVHLVVERTVLQTIIVPLSYEGNNVPHITRVCLWPRSWPDAAFIGTFLVHKREY